MWRKRQQIERHFLDQPLLMWTDQDPFRIRDLLNGGVLILGRAGSGKTSSSGRTLQQAIVSHPRSGGLILCAKPEDVDDITSIFSKAGRSQDIILFDPGQDWRFNFLEFVGNDQVRNIVQCIMAIAETLKRGERKGGGDDGAFWEQQNERLIYNAVAALQAAEEAVTAPNIQRFIMTAATSPAELAAKEWRDDSYHCQTLFRGFAGQKTPLEAHDFELAKDFWLGEYPKMDPKTRNNILAGVMGILHVFNVGIVREMISGRTNFTPDDILAGKWVVSNWCPSVYGAVALFLNSGLKYLTQQAILKRKADHQSAFVTIWADEAHQFVNSFDVPFIAQCRSHRGCMVYLSQSISSFYAALKGEAGKHQADALVANFSHTIIHASDPETAKWGAAKLGRVQKLLPGGSYQPTGDYLWDELFGAMKFSGSFHTNYEQVLQDQEFQHGLRTGGPDNQFEADAIVIKSGESFADGKNHKFVTFSQR